MAKIVLPKVTCSHEYEWTIKSTTAERGEVLLAIGHEWTGDGHTVEGVEATYVEAIAVEQVTDLLTAIREHAGNAAVLRVIHGAIDQLNDVSCGFSEPTDSGK